MEPIAVEVRRKESQPSSLEADMQAARWLAKMLDAQFEVAGVKVGMDAVIGLLPVIGDTISAVIGTYPIYLARKHKLGRRVEMRMWANLAIDYATGLVPVVGDVFDIAFKANLKNLALLEKAITAKSRT